MIFQKKNYFIKEKILKILSFFRFKGHKYSDINPLNKKKYKKKINKLNYIFFNFNKNYLNKKININKNLNIKQKFLNFDIFLKWIKKKYCSTIGFEFCHINSKKEKKWIQSYIEKNWKKSSFKKKKKLDILNAIIYSQTFEKYINTKYPGYKRFSLEGNDSLIPGLYELITYSIKKNILDLYIGMAHRGRLNVLINVLGKSTTQLFKEFSGKCNTLHNGDVKYHLGYYSKVKTKYNTGRINLEYNPSHLEIINPVVMGLTRSRIDFLKFKKNHSVLSIMIHGDASFSGQGVIQEILNMSQTKGYNVGGSLHIIINNQIGFTTSDINSMRSSYYCTDIAKLIESPIFHVNSDDPEAFVFSIKMSIDYRKKFKKDVFIDLIGYRKNGHNESEEPSVTQPLMYKKIKNHRSIQEIYSKKLINEKIIKIKQINKIESNYINTLDKGLVINPNYSSLKFQSFLKKKKSSFNKVKLKFSKNKLIKIFKLINTLPKNFNAHPLVKKIYLNRLEMIKKNKKLDWGAAENLAYGYLLKNGVSCRISGEDVSRGTFFHRHISIYDQINGKKYTPLKNIKNSKFYIWDSVLSEEAVLAFEYGYSLRNKNTLNIWEAQFGDFSNVAQVVIDQFISSSMEKWNQTSGIVIYLPHGYEGQGPEHSSARIERYLQLCSNDNMRVCIPTNSSQIFHLLFSHVHKKMNTPLIIFSPKSLLRNPLSSSSFSEIYNGKFQKLIYDKSFIKNKNISKIIFCSGKIYYELLEKYKLIKIKNILIIKIEQFYPFPKIKIKKIIKKYFYVKNIFWCQEEPSNQGAWNYIKNIFEKILSNQGNIKYIGRNSSSSSATGNIYIHKKEQLLIIDSVFKNRI
ncbi:2-oxoglutarate dehydrogenase E1 component [Buchnera aphidicola]|uniref:2-oxoglutarate dehydrogenase E1 component n=1 Tax=Buchnera aphidicola TaxID=9 RepID=UPI003F540B5D